MRTGRASGRAIAAAAAAVATILSGIGVGAASSPVAPHQQFAGLVNGKGQNVSVAMQCFGPIKTGEKGHPSAGQTLEVVIAEVLATAGDTGNRGTAIDAHFAQAPSTKVRFTRYGVALPIPTSLLLPCAGAGTVVFASAPSRSGARSFTVTVNFVGQP
jgi:hypothetical protein